MTRIAPVAERLLGAWEPPFGELARSVEGRPITAARLGPVDAARRLLLFGGIHGDEPLGVDLCVALARAAARTGLSAGLRLVVVPAVNPDGLVRRTKDNARGVDLNRNFPARSFGTARPGYDPGPAPLSEPESRALAELIARERPSAILSIHSPFRVVNPDGSGRALAERMARACGYPVVEDLGYPTPGSFGSWMGHDQGRAVVTLEVPPMAPDEAWALHEPTLRAALD